MGSQQAITRNAQNSHGRDPGSGRQASAKRSDGGQRRVLNDFFDLFQSDQHTIVASFLARHADDVLQRPDFQSARGVRQRRQCPVSHHRETAQRHLNQLAGQPTAAHAQHRDRLLFRKRTSKILPLILGHRSFYSETMKWLHES